MGHVRKAESGRYEARYRDPNGRERSKTFATKQEANRFLERTGADKQRGAWTDPRAGKVTLGRWVEEWWTTTTNLRPSTRVRDRGYLDRYIIPAFGAAPMATISQLDVRAWVADLSAQGLAPATVTKAYQILGKVLAAAVDSGLIAVSPCRRVPLPRIERDEQRFLRPEEIARLADAIHPRYRALVLVGAYGGLRIGELAGLRPGRVDLLRGRVDVAEICVEVRGHLTFGQPKTRAGRRTVTLPRTVATELAAHMNADPAREYVFCAPEGGPLRVPLWRRRFWQPAVAAAGLAPLRPHDLRHTAVALWIAAGANPLEVSRRAGHTSVSFTLDRYGHLFEDADQALSDRLEGLVVAPAPAPSADVISITG